MSHSMDSVTAATKLRNDMHMVQKDLEDKRAEFKRIMDAVKVREENLKVKRQKLQDTLVQYYKLIQENEIKRTRANKKALLEEKAKQERHDKILELSELAKRLEKQKQESREKYLQYQKYQRYLEEVLQHNDNEEYQDPKDIILRYQTLDDNKQVLQKRKTQLEEELAKNKISLTMKRQRKKNESVDLQNQLSELQNRLESLQKEFKKKQDDLDSDMNHKSTTTKTIGQVRMACQNLYDRCVAVNSTYKSRGTTNEQGDTDILSQLNVIGDCLEDYIAIIKKHQERVREKQSQMGIGVSGAAGGGGGGAAAGAAGSQKPKATGASADQPVTEGSLRAKDSNVSKKAAQTA